MVGIAGDRERRPGEHHGRGEAAVLLALKSYRGNGAMRYATGVSSSK